MSGRQRNKLAHRQEGMLLVEDGNDVANAHIPRQHNTPSATTALIARLALGLGPVVKAKGGRG